MISTMYPRFLAGSYYVSPVNPDNLKELNDKLSELPDLKAMGRGFTMPQLM